MRIQTKTAGRSKALGLCLLNRATFPSDVPRWRDLPRSWFSLQRRLCVNHVLVATTQKDKVVGSVEVHTPQYQQKQAKGVYTPDQLAKLQPYLASLAVREDMRGRGIGRKLVEAAVEAVRSSSYAGKYMLLGVEDNNTAAVRLYENCGFVTLSEPGCQVRLMRRQLDLQPRQRVDVDVDVQPRRVMEGL
jgi:ribosomal protein S18 acetylase RimI-like enzyme